LDDIAAEYLVLPVMFANSIDIAVFKILMQYFGYLEIIMLKMQ
jgi:hypothetical protein